MLLWRSFLIFYFFVLFWKTIQQRPVGGNNQPAPNLNEQMWCKVNLNETKCLRQGNKSKISATMRNKRQWIRLHPETRLTPVWNQQSTKKCPSEDKDKKKTLIFKIIQYLQEWIPIIWESCCLLISAAICRDRLVVGKCHLFQSTTNPLLEQGAALREEMILFNSCCVKRRREFLTELLADTRGQAVYLPLTSE